VKQKSVPDAGHRSKRQENAEKPSKDADPKDNKTQSVKNIQKPGQFVSAESLNIIIQSAFLNWNSENKNFLNSDEAGDTG
jgi:hypothetical protein